MSFYKTYPNRKDHREEYLGSKKHSDCKHHGSCDRCKHDRTIDIIKNELVAKYEIKTEITLEKEEQNNV